MAKKHGGVRPGAGRKPIPPEVKALKAEAAAKAKALKLFEKQSVGTTEVSTMPAAVPPGAVRDNKSAIGKLQAEAKQFTVDVNMASQVIADSKALARSKNRAPELNPFQVASHPPTATPPKAMQMAMDDGLSWASGQWAGTVLANVAAEGLLFLGYPFLAELAQRPEYRVISETVATEMTRKWIGFKAVGDDSEEKAKKIKELEDEFDRLEVRDRFKELAIQDGLFGRSHLFIDLDNDLDGGDDNELTTPIGDGRDAVSRGKVKKKSLSKLKCVEAVWTYPTTYNAVNPLKNDWYNPQIWYVMGKQIHATRLLTFIGHPVPDLLKPAYSFGGLSLSQMAKPYVDIWLETRAAVGQLIHSFSVMVLMTDMQTILQPNNMGGLMSRVAMFNALRDNQGTFVLNKATEDFKNVSASLSGLHELQAQSQEHMMSVARIPAVKFTGIQPSGLNASSEGEIRAFYDTIASYQQGFFRPNLTKIMHFVMLSLWGKIDEEITFDFNPLWELSEKEKSDMRKADAETGQILIDAGVIWQEEERARVANDPETLYPGLDVDDVPDLREEEEQGLEPEGGRPDPLAEAGPELGSAPDKGGGKGGGGKKDDKDDDEDKGGEGGGQDSNVTPFVDGDSGADALFAADAEFKEPDHPRSPGGQFQSKGGGKEHQKFQAPQYGLTKPASHSGSQKQFSWHNPPPATPPSPLDPNKLKRIGETMGSNPGGVFEDSQGHKFYIKKGKSKEHVREELLAAALYDMANSETLTYRPVEGGEHIATELRKLGKSNASQLSDSERDRARADFVTHAWLANWDAVGTGGDNIGTVQGVPTSLDLGGALSYRAQGSPKGAKFGDKVGELDTLRDPHMNPDSAGLFGDISPAELRESARQVTTISDSAIRKAVDKAGAPKELGTKLIARRDDIAAKARDFGAQGKPEAAASTVIFNPGADLPVKELNGVAFSKWKPPANTEGWAKVEGQADIEEPELPPLPKGKQQSSGVLVREKDGRVWMMRPSNGFGGYEHTFPKGRIDAGLSPQANAIKEAYEETGLKVKITGFAGDHEGDTTSTRYYTAEREGGDPADAGKESDGVVLAPKDKLGGFLNRKRDRNVAEMAGDVAFKEDDHPRQEGGKFISKGGSEGGGETDDPMKPPFPMSKEKPDYAHAVVKQLIVNGKQYGMTPEKYVETNIPANKLRATQSELKPYGLDPDNDDDEIEGGGEAPFPGFEKLPVILRSGGEYNVLDGHNRISTQIRSGEPVSAYVFEDVDLDNSERAAIAKQFASDSVFDALDATFEESKHPRDPDGQFTSTGGGGEGSAEEVKKQYKNFTPSTSANIHINQAAKVLQAPAKSGTTYRWMVNMLIKEVDEFPSGHAHPKESIASLKLKIAESWDKELQKALFKDDLNTAKKIQQKMIGLGWKFGGNNTGSPAAPTKYVPTPSPTNVTYTPSPPTPVSYTPPTTSYGAPTEAELAKAKKTVALQAQYVPGAPQSGPEGQKAQKLIDAFNDVYSGKTLTDPGDLAKKVAAFKDLQKSMIPLMGEAQQKQAIAAEEQKKEQAAKQAQYEAAHKAETEKKKADQKKAMSELGISETQAEGFAALVKMMGGSQADLIDSFKKYENMAKQYGYPITGFQAALIKNYTGSGYEEINENLRSGSWSTAQHIYVKLVNQGLQKMPTYKGVTKRGTNLSSKEQGLYIVGNVVEERAFTSTSPTSPWHGNTQYTINAIGKRGADVKKLSSHAHEDEVVFSARTFFRVDKVEGSPGGNMHVTMTEVEE